MKALKSLLSETAVVESGYASTEAGAMSMLKPGEPWIPGYTGHIVEGVDVLYVNSVCIVRAMGLADFSLHRIANPETLEDVGTDVGGEICVRSTMTFTGYVNNEAATKSAFLTNSTGVWHRTGDKGQISSKVEQLMVTGRYKENFKVGSEDVSPEEVEAVISKHDAIDDVAVTSTAGRLNRGDFELIEYVVASDSNVSAQQIVDFVAERLSSHKAPTGGVVFCDTIPRTSFGKVPRGKLLDAVKGDSRSTGYIQLSE